jgi:hypothetical protein
MSSLRGDRSLREERVRPARDARRWLLGATLAGCAAIGGWAPSAGAATVTHEAGAAGASYTAGTGELNRLAVGGTGALVELFDPAGITAPDPDVPPLNDCITPSTGAAVCAAAALAASLGDGDDALTTLGGAPAITASGGAGGDALLDRARSQGTVFQGGEGLDRADYSGRAEAIAVSLNDLADDGAAAEGDNITVEDLVGGAGSDAIAGDGAANGLSGGPGNDGIAGGGGNDVLLGGAGDDAVNGGDGNDQLIGGAGVDSLAGGPGADTISAADGVAETIDCGSGADTTDVDRGAGGVSDVVVNCETVTGPVGAVRAPGVANPADLTPPAASMRAAIRQRIATVRVRGVPLRVLCRESCGLSAALALDRPTTRRLGLGTRAGGAVIGKATARRATPGAVRIRVKLSRRARQALARTTRKVAVTVQVLVSDASGNGTLLQRRITLVR